MPDNDLSRHLLSQLPDAGGQKRDVLLDELLRAGKMRLATPASGAPPSADAAAMMQQAYPSQPPQGQAYNQLRQRAEQAAAVQNLQRLLLLQKMKGGQP